MHTDLNPTSRHLIGEREIGLTARLSENPLGLGFLLSKFRQNAGMAPDAATIEQAIGAWSPEGEVGDVSAAVKSLVAD